MINKTKQTQSEKFVHSLAATQREVQRLKQVQFVGAENIPALQVSGTASITLAAGASHGFTINFTGGIKGFYVSEFGYTIFVNVNGDLAHLWFSGGALTPDDIALTVQPHYDIGLSSEVSTGTKTYGLLLTNTGTASKTLYITFGLNFYKGATGA